MGPAGKCDCVTTVLPGAPPFFEPPLSETPSTKPQSPEKFHISNTKPQNQMPRQTRCRSVFELGAWCFFVAWRLGTGSFSLCSQLLTSSDAPIGQTSL